MVTYSSILAWEIPWTEELGGLQFMGVTKEWDTTQQLYNNQCNIYEMVSKCQSLSHARLFATPWTTAHKAPLSVRFFRQEYWSGLPFSPPGSLPSPRTEPTFPVSPALQMDSLPLSLWGSPVRLFTVSHFERVVFPVQPLTDCTYSSFLESQI